MGCATGTAPHRPGAIDAVEEALHARAVAGIQEGGGGPPVGMGRPACRLRFLLYILGRATHRLFVAGGGMGSRRAARGIPFTVGYIVPKAGFGSTSLSRGRQAVT